MMSPDLMRSTGFASDQYGRHRGRSGLEPMGRGRLRPVGTVAAIVSMPMSHRRIRGLYR